MKYIGWINRGRVVLTAALMLVCYASAGSDVPQKAPLAGKQKTGSQQNTIVVIGASYARSWDVSTLAGMPVINKGIGGEQTHEMLARFDRDVLAMKPRAVIIWGFINDIFRSKPEELESKLVRSRENINAMIHKARKNRIVPILATEVTLPAGSGWSEKIAAWIGALRGKQGYQDYVNAHVDEMNQWIRRQAVEQRLTLLDFEKVLADGSGSRKPEYATKDGTHLSVEAYQALTGYTEHVDLGL